jgi:alpha-amylase/alpha-mannosidase (GH57 family)
MANKLQVAFLWHMHQPYYVDTHRGAALMPWVRLHATKGYLDMIWLVEKFPSFRCTFNLTPVLLKQIEQIARGEVRDLWHELSAAPAAELTPEQRTSILEHFFKANWDNMVKPHPRYWMLLQKRGHRPTHAELTRRAAAFNEQEYRDLQVWFNLTWFGYAAAHLYPEIAELKHKGANFTEDDKRILFAQQQDVLENVVSCYKARAEAGQIEISTTPFYHPIMPLVYNTDFTRRCMPTAKLPETYSHPEDVRAHLIMARDYHRQLFGSAPAGIWPSEGSVCPEMIPILQELDLKWFATDEEILWRSLGDTGSRHQLFQGHRAWFGDSSACAAFRERTLSDFIGFTAARNEPKRAADFIVHHLKEIAKGQGTFCPIILDGENAWENFRDGGEAFLSELYQRLSDSDDIETTTFNNYFRQYPPKNDLRNLHTGSWINGNFHIWIGHPEDVQAWNVLGRTRDFLEAKLRRNEISPDQYRQAMQEIYAAEGSDWFWWYGDDFVTDNDLIFDELFRTHLQNVYRIVGAPVPDLLKIPICRSESRTEYQTPTGLIRPIIDGQLTSYYEWAGAGVYEPGRSMGAMYQAERIITAIHFGADRETFSMRLDFTSKQLLPARLKVRVIFAAKETRTLTISGFDVEKLAVEFSHGEGAGIQAVYGRVAELSLPLHLIADSTDEKLTFTVQVLDEEVEVERHPSADVLSLDIPDEEAEAKNWWV